MKNETNLAHFEALISGQIENDFGIKDDFLGPELTSGLRNNLLMAYEQGKMQPAAIGRNSNHHTNELIRKDLTLWLDKDSTDPFEKSFLSKIEDFVGYLNATCYTGINDFEFHYAFYDVGSFYKRHRDQFRSNAGRKYSLVSYLNEHWEESDGGHLSLYQNDQAINLLPHGGRTVFFKSDEVEHEVHPSMNKPRLSITGWLKSI